MLEAVSRPSPLAGFVDQRRSGNGGGALRPDCFTAASGKTAIIERLTLHADNDRIPGCFVPRNDLFVVVFEQVHVEVRRQ